MSNQTFFCWPVWKAVTVLNRVLRSHSLSATISECNQYGWHCHLTNTNFFRKKNIPSLERKLLLVMPSLYRTVWRGPTKTSSSLYLQDPFFSMTFDIYDFCILIIFCLTISGYQISKFVNGMNCCAVVIIEPAQRDRRIRIKRKENEIFAGFGCRRYRLLSCSSAFWGVGKRPTRIDSWAESPTSTIVSVFLLSGGLNSFPALQWGIFESSQTELHPLEAKPSWRFSLLVFRRLVHNYIVFEHICCVY